MTDQSLKKKIKRERGRDWGIEKEREVEPRKYDEYRRNCMCFQSEIEIEIVKKRQKEKQLVRKQSKRKSFPNVKGKYDIHTKRRKRNITDKTFCDFFPSNIFFLLSSIFVFYLIFFTSFSLFGSVLFAFHCALSIFSLIVSSCRGIFLLTSSVLCSTKQQTNTP